MKEAACGKGRGLGGNGGLRASYPIRVAVEGCVAAAHRRVSAGLLPYKHGMPPHGVPYVGRSSGRLHPGALHAEASLVAYARPSLQGSSGTLSDEQQVAATEFTCLLASEVGE